MSTSPRALILSAPSGTGKTTLARRLVELIPDSRLSVSITTRPPRGQEKDGLDYHFTDDGRFDELVAKGELLEWATVHGHRYGTPLKALQDPGTWVVLDIDVQGGESVKQRLPQSVTVFILPPAWADLESRLRGRQTDSPEVIQRRLAAARAEIERGLATYDYVVVNGLIARALEDLQAVARAEGCRLLNERHDLERRFGL